MAGQGIAARTHPTTPAREQGSPRLGVGHLSGDGNDGPRTEHQPARGCGCRISRAVVRGRHGMTVLGLDLCFSNVLRSDCIFHVHFNTRQIVLCHCMCFINYGRGNHTAREMSHTEGFAGRLNYEKFSHHQTVWTP